MKAIEKVASMHFLGYENAKKQLVKAKIEQIKIAAFGCQDSGNDLPFPAILRIWHLEIQVNRSLLLSICVTKKDSSNFSKLRVSLPRAPMAVLYLVRGVNQVADVVIVC